MPTVAGFNLTPVKSTRTHRPDAIDLRRRGAVGDRRFLFVREDGTRPSGVSKASLMPIRATYDADEEHLTLILPGGEQVSGDARGSGDPIEVALYDRSVTARRIDPVLTEATRTEIDPTLSLARVDEPEYAGGMHRVTLVSRASVADVGARIGDAALDPRRFRMLVEVDGLDAFEEDGWAGRRVRIGAAVVRVVDRVPRCVMTTLNPDTGLADAPVLDALATYRKMGNDLLLGVWADVEEEGSIHAGDRVTSLG